MSVATNLNGSVPTAVAGTIDANGVRLGVFEDTETAPDGHRKTKLTFVNQPVVLVDEAGVVAYGARKVYAFPEGLIGFEGAVARLDITKSSTGVNADFDGDVGLGSVTASNNATLSSTEQDYIPTTSTPQAVSGVTTADSKSTSTEAYKLLDGTGTSKDMFLNLLVDDADHDVTSTPCNLIVNGNIVFHWKLLGDL